MLFHRLLIDALEKSLKKTSGEDLCKELYEGKVSNQILCMTCKTISTREEAFYDLNLQIIDCQDTAESLRQYCRAEVLSGDSAYQCDVCRVKRTALRASVICDIPRILTFSCSRFRIDKSTNWNRVKVTSKNEFPLIINMTAFMNRKDGINDAIDEAEAEKQMVEILRREKMSWLRIASTKADEWAQKLVEKFGEKQPAQYLALLTDNEIASILREIIGTSVDCAYEDKLFLLQAVIMHRGSAHSGHYFAYIRDSMAEGKWDIDSTSAAFFSSSNDSVKGKKGSKKKSSNVSIEIDGVCMTSDVVNGAARMLKSHEFFVEDTGDSHLIYIDETSPAGILVKLINQHSSVKYDTGSNNKRRHLSDSGISLHKLGVEFTSAQGRSWSELHHEKCGPLTKFMKGLPQIFRVMKSKVLLADNLVSLSAADYKEMTKKDAVQSSSSTTVDMEVVDEDMMCDSDEALARALQDKEYDDVKIFDDSASTTAAADDAEWEEVSATKKKDKKKRNNPNIPAKKVENSSKIVNSPTTNKKLEDTELVKISVAKPELLEIPVKSLTMQKLAAYLLSLVFGNFFEFNDSLIRAMPLYGLEKAFEGPDSAYLLVYRAIDLQSDIILPALGMKNSCTVSVKTNSTTSKFDYWTKKIQQENESLAKQRLEYEVKHSRMIIRIFCPGQFRYVHPFLMSVDIDYGEKMLDHGETIQTTSDRVKIVAFKSNCIEVDVDGRMYLKELIETLVASLDVSLLDLLEIKPTMEKENSSYPLVLSPVSKCGKGFHSSVSLDHQLLVSDTIDKGPNFLLWDGLSIGNERVLVGSEALPISVAVYKLDSNGGQSKNKTQSIQIVNRNDEYWIPGNLTLETLAVEIARQMQIELESLCLHILADKDLQANSSNSSETRSKKHRVKATLSTAIKLFDGRTFTGKPLIVKKYGSGYGLPLSVLLSGTTTVKELGSGTQLLVEHTEGRAFKQQSLAEQYVESLNTTITFKVRLLKPAIKDDNVKAVTNEVILLDDTEAEEKNTCQVTILLIFSLENG